MVDVAVVVASRCCRHRRWWCCCRCRCCCCCRRLSSSSSSPLSPTELCGIKAAPSLSGRLQVEEERPDGTPNDHWGGNSRRREFCHFADTPLFIPIETPAEGRVGCSRMTVLPTARREHPEDRSGSFDPGGNLRTADNRGAAHGRPAGQVSNTAHCPLPTAHCPLPCPLPVPTAVPLPCHYRPTTGPLPSSGH